MDWYLSYLTTYTNNEFEYNLNVLVTFVNISPMKRNVISKKYITELAGNAFLGLQDSKCFWGSMPPDPSTSSQTE